ncbi:MAG TPA: hypothetical protein VFU21_24240 [Kofleriaceae bacterium]|nr:hypothetical protein [Kofleriaceae bacterium]
MPDDSGSLLVSAGLVAEEQLARARDLRQQIGGTIGEHLVLAGVVDDETLAGFYAAKLRVPRVSEKDLAAIPTEILRKIPPDMAAEFRILPIGHDGEQNLTVAMADPADTHAVDEVTFFTGCYVVRAVATQSQMAWGLGRYYQITTPLTGGGTAPKPSRRAYPRAAFEQPIVALDFLDDEEDTGSHTVDRRARDGNSRELPPRSGELQAQEPPPKTVVDRLPAVVVDDDELGDEAEAEEAIVLLDRPRSPSGKTRPLDDEPDTVPERGPGGEPPDWEGGSDGGVEDVVELSQVKRTRRRTSRQTEPGLGRLGAVDSRAEERQDTEDLPGHRGAPPGDDYFVTRSKTGRSSANTTPVEKKASAKQPERSKRPSVDDGWDVDDGWGPPGTTIPPQFIGAVPSALEAEGTSGSIPLPVGDEPTGGEELAAENAAAAPAAPVATPEADTARVPANHAAQVSAPIAAPAVIAAPPEPVDPVLLAQELERSSNRLLETVRKLERSGSRDQVIDVLLDHLGIVCQRRAFFAIKGGRVVPFRQQGAARPGVGTGELSLEEPSTFGQVAASRLPYHGTVSPAASQFVAKGLGGAPRGETVVVPVLLRGRAVALVYGDGIQGRVFDEHLMVLGRAAGQALERIVKSSKSA